MTDNKLNDLAMQMVNSMKTMDDFKQIQQLMLQQFINNSLEAEMQEHLGYAKHEKSEQPNKRNGKMRKTPHCQNSCHPHPNNLNGGKGDNHGTIQSRTQTSHTKQTFIT